MNYKDEYKTGLVSIMLMMSPLLPAQTQYKRNLQLYLSGKR